MIQKLGQLQVRREQTQRKADYDNEWIIKRTRSCNPGIQEVNLETVKRAR